MTGRTVYIRAEDICIDADEDGYSLLVTDEDSGNSISINIQHIVLDFYNNVVSTIGPYAAEADSARRAVASGMSRADYLDSPQPVTSRPVSVEDAIEAGYALDDPKSPNYHERMVD